MSIYDVYSHILLVEHLFAYLAYSQGEHEQHTSVEQIFQHVLKGSMDILVHLGIYKGRAQSEISAGTQGEYGQQNVYQGREYLGSSFALDVKGGELLVMVVSVKSKGGDCWHYDACVVLHGNPLVEKHLTYT